MLLRITLAGLLLAAAFPASPGSAERWLATYTITAAGITVMDAEVRFTLGAIGTPYSIETRARSRGVASWLMRVDSQSRSEGLLRPGATLPRRHESASMWRGAPRRTLLEYGADGQPRIATLEPSQDMERTPVPEEARRGSIDSLSAMVLLTAQVRQTARCDIETRTFDGRRLTQFVVTTDPVVPVGEQGLLRCLVESRPLAGVPTDRPLEDAMRPTQSVLVFGVARPGAPALPVRVEIASRWWGTIQAHLVELASAD